MLYDLNNNKFKDYEFLKGRIKTTNIDDWKSIDDLMDDICQIIVGPVWQDDAFIFPTSQSDYQFNAVVHDLIKKHGTLMHLLRGCFMRERAYDVNTLLVSRGRVCLGTYCEHMINFLSDHPDPRYFGEVQTNS